MGGKGGKKRAEKDAKTGRKECENGQKRVQKRTEGRRDILEGSVFVPFWLLFVVTKYTNKKKHLVT